MPEPDDDRRPISAARIGIWVLAGGIGAYLLVTGIVTAVTAGR